MEIYSPQSPRSSRRRFREQAFPHSPALLLVYLPSRLSLALQWEAVAQEDFPSRPVNSVEVSHLLHLLVLLKSPMFPNPPLSSKLPRILPRLRLRVAHPAQLVRPKIHHDHDSRTFVHTFFHILHRFCTCGYNSRLPYDLDESHGPL